jgi:hypothetical protein
MTDFASEIQFIRQNITSSDAALAFKELISQMQAALAPKPDPDDVQHLRFALEIASKALVDGRMPQIRRTALVQKLTRQVTYRDDPPYPELKTVLEAVVDGLSHGEPPQKAVDWPAIVAEAVNLRPQH